MALTSKQTPDDGEIFLDHVGWYVSDLDDVVECFNRLGFPVTPYSLHGDKDPKTGEIIPQGSANRLVMLERGYLEFLTPVPGTDTVVSRHIRDRMALYQGLHLTAFTVSDAAAEAARIMSAGIDLQPTVNLRRSIEAEDGSEVEVAFSVVRARFDLYPEGRVQSLTHHTPDQVWQNRYIGHDNAIIGLDELVYMVDDPSASAARLAQFTGRAFEAMSGSASVLLDRGKLTFLNQEQAKSLLNVANLPQTPASVAIGMISRDLALTRDYLAGKDIRLSVDEAARIVVDPTAALGAALIIHESHD